VTGGQADNHVHALDPDAVRSLSELLGGDHEALAELVDAFVDEAPRRLAELRQGADQGDAALAGRAAHTLKSNGLTFGAVEFASLCRRLEVAAGANELADSRGLIDRVDGQWTRVREELTTLRDRGRL
jgi:HPt (histidine-containing phosphotransfer) domain-containing protein